MATDVSIATVPITNRPYTPPSNVTAILQRLRSRNLPERIDADYLRDAGVPEGTVNRTLFALRFLRLIDDDGSPSPALRSIATSTDEEYQAILAETIRDVYHDVFEVLDPAQDSQQRILNFFRRYTPASQRERMVIFFLGMCREAGIATLDSPRNRASNVSTGPKAGSPKPAKPASRTTTRTPSSSGQTDDRGKGLPDMPPALQLLVRSLPPEGTPLSASRRQQWLEMAKATLAFIYPAEEAEVQEEDDLNDEEQDG